MTEIAVLAKYTVGHLGFCQLVQSGGTRFPRAQIRTALQIPEFVIYKSVAAKVAYFPRPTQVVEFYTRFGEIPHIISLIEHSPASDSAFILPDEINGLADLIITQCQIIAALLANPVHDPISEHYLSEGLRTHMLDELHQQLLQAKELFPQSEAFQGQST
jgi:hypothetical protein